MVIASLTNSVCMCSRIDQPTILREHRSITAAKYSQPSPVGMYVMSTAHFLLSEEAAKSRFNRFLASG